MLAFIKTINSEESQDLMAKYPNTYSLLHIIASRVDTETQLAKVYPSLLNVTVAEYRTALKRLVDSGLVEIVEASRGKGGNTIVRLVSDSVVDTTLKKTTFANTQNYDSLTATQTLPKLITNLSQTYHKLLEQLENIVNAYEKADYEDKQNIEQTYNELYLNVTETLPKRILEKYNRNIKEINNTVFLQKTSLNVSNNSKQKKEKAPPIADTPATEKSLRQKISDMFCLEWYPQKYVVQGQPKEYEFKKSQDGKNLNEIENKLKSEFAKVKKREGTDEEILKFFGFILNYGANNHWADHITLQLLNSRFSEFYIKADEIYKKEKAEEKAKKQTPTVQSFDKTKTGEAKRLREKHEKWLAEETAKRAATKQAGE